MTQVTYAQSNGTQYIDTCFRGNNNITLELKGSINNVSETQFIYGGRTRCCLYDRVEKKYYYGIGGDFVAGQ